METIGIIGMGKLGLCLAINLERAGFSVAGAESDGDRRNAIRQRSVRSREKGLKEELKACRNLEVYSGIAEVLASDAKVVFVCVQTPSVEGGGYDHGRIVELLEEFASVGRSIVLRDLVIVSTTMPGCCEAMAEKLLSLNWNVLYNPEFISQGNILEEQRNPQQILIGCASKEKGERLLSIWKKTITNQPEIHFLSFTEAEIAKIATNCFLTMKISFANAIGDLAKMSGAEPGKVLEAIGADSRIGNLFLKYGFGFGGPCLPRDNQALLKYAAGLGMTLLLSDAAVKENQNHLEWQFREMCVQHPNGNVIEFDSITYKPGTGITEESQQLALALMLANSGRKVLIQESEEVIAGLQRDFADLFQYKIRDAE